MQEREPKNTLEVLKGDKRILCLIPSKGSSKRIPQKNIKKLGEKPLVLYTIEAAIESKVFDDIYISTEDEKVEKISKINRVKIHKRDKKLTVDPVTIEDVAINFIYDIEKQGEKYDILCLLLPTSPLRTSQDIQDAFTLFFKREADFLISITELETPSFKTLKEENDILVPIFDDLFFKKRSELPKSYRNNGAIMISKISEFKKQKTLYGQTLIGYKMPAERSVDIDSDIDFLLANILIEKKSN